MILDQNSLEGEEGQQLLIYLLIYLFISIYLSIYLSISSIYLSVYLSIYLGDVHDLGPEQPGGGGGAAVPHCGGQWRTTISPGF